MNPDRGGAVPTKTVQNLLEVSMGAVGLTPRVFLLEQEAFTNPGGTPLLPAILHTPLPPIIRRSQRGQKVIRAVFAVRIHSDNPGELDQIHASLEGLSPKVSAAINISLVSAGLDDELHSYWRTLEMTIPGRGLHRLEVPRNRLFRLVWGDNTGIVWGDDTAISW